MTDRFAHRLRLDQIRDGDRLELVADEAERAAVATRLALPGIDRFEAHATLSRAAGELVRASGRLVAIVEQNCVVTGEPVPAHIDEHFELVFMPEPRAGGADEEIERARPMRRHFSRRRRRSTSAAAVADTLALSLDPYPRSAGAEGALKGGGRS